MQIAFDISENDFEWIKKWAKDGTNIPVYDTLAKYIANAKILPKEDEQKTGKWIYVNSNTFKCSSCGNFLNFNGVNAGRGDANYCPNCGIRMEIDENG